MTNKFYLFLLLVSFSLQSISAGLFNPPASKPDALNSLSLSIKRGKLEDVSTFLKANPNEINSTIESGMNALHMAVASNKLNIAKLLLELGADVNALNKHAFSPLHFAALYGFFDLAELLIKAGADLNLKCKNNGTALNYAQNGKNPKIAALLISQNADQSPWEFPEFRGNYFGSELPSQEPVLFAPDFITYIYRPHGNIAISPKGNEIYWTRNSADIRSYEKIWFSRIENKKWTAPQLANFSNQRFSAPCFSPDGNKLFFKSEVAVSHGPPNTEIFYVERMPNGWSEAKNLGKAVNTTGMEFTGSISKNNSFYFSRVSRGENGFVIDLYKSIFENGTYTLATNLGNVVNSPAVEAGPFVAPDESYLLFQSKRKGGIGNLPDEPWISFKQSDGKWGQPISVRRHFPDYKFVMQGISPDGKYLIYNGDDNGSPALFWVEAKILNQISQK